MRPIRLRLHGFGPFRDEVEVDFNELDLFALVGSTGSGKSTVIDGLTFALFGRIARLDAKAVAPVINAMSSEARVVLDFEVDGEAYVAARVVRRTKTGASTKEIRLERGDEVLAEGKEVEAAVEDLLGLNFDRFTRVVVLPQGKFAEFLHDKPAARQELLRRMLNLGIYERMGQRARQFKATATSQLEVLRPNLEVAGVTDEQVAQLETEAVSLRELQASLKAQLDSRDSLVAAKKAADEQAHDFGVLALACANVHVPDEVAELGARLDEATKAQAAAVAAETAAQADSTNAAQAVADGPDGAEAKRSIERLDELDGLVARLKDSAKQVEDATKARTAADEQAAKQQERVAEVETKVQAAEQAVTKARAAVDEGPSEAQLVQARAAHQAVEDAAKSVADLQSQLDSGLATVAEAEGAVATAKQAAEEATAQVQLIERDAHVDVLVATLAVGDECPVCLQTVGDLPDHTPSGELDTARATEGAAKRDLDDARTNLAKVEQAQAQVQGRLDDAKTASDRATAALGDHPALSDLDAMAADIDKLKAQAAASTAERDTVAAALVELRSSDDVAGAAAAQRDAAVQLTKAETSHAELEQRIDELRTTGADAPTRSDLEAMVRLAAELAERQQSMSKAATSARQARVDADSTCAHVREEETTWRGRFDEQRRPFLAIDSVPVVQHNSLRDDWQAFAEWGRGQIAPLEEHAREATRTAVEAGDQLNVADAAIQELVDGAEPFVGVDVDAMSETAIAAVAQADAAAGNARRLRDQYAEQRSQVASLEEDEQVYGMLGNLLRSDGFEQWLLDEVIEVLVERASERLHELSGGQYSIEAEGMDFQVRDHRNGDELRDARTLSGGETFLASLSLALALADSIQEMAPDGAPPIESLFLDEGFGTLDPATLDVVAAAIEELGASGRMVGVITHIRDLAERMPVRFEVTKQATTSIVEKVDA